jgi:hypothetical protein
MRYSIRYEAETWPESIRCVALNARCSIRYETYIIVVQPTTLYVGIIQYHTSDIMGRLATAKQRTAAVTGVTESESESPGAGTTRDGSLSQAQCGS